MSAAGVTSFTAAIVPPRQRCYGALLFVAMPRVRLPYVKPSA